MPFEFLLLPPEIRNKIYEYLFAKADFIRPSNAPESSHSLLQTCRQIHAEARPYLYCANGFYLTDTGYFNDFQFTILSWLDDIGPENRSLLRKLHIDWTCDVREIAYFPSVRTILALMEEWSPLDDVLNVAMESFMAHYSRGICRVLSILAESCQELKILTIIVPGLNESDIGIESNGFFNNDFFSNGEIGDALANIKGVERLSIGHTVNFTAVERRAGQMGVKEVCMIWRKDDINFPEDLWPEVLGRAQDDGWVLTTAISSMMEEISPVGSLPTSVSYAWKALC